MLTARDLLAWLFALISAAMLGLAAGAVWMLAALFAQRPLPWLALPVAWLLAWAIRGWVRPAGGPAAVLAVMASLLASIYMSLLTAGIRVAGSLGLPLVAAMRQAGLRMLLQLAMMGISAAALCWFAGGALLAAWVATGRARAR